MSSNRCKYWSEDDVFVSTEFSMQQPGVSIFLLTHLVHRVAYCQPKSGSEAL